MFNDELLFEQDLIKLLIDNGWEKEIIKYPTEKDLLKNWANILFENNREIDRLNGYPLTEGEMNQILAQINSLGSPNATNQFINGKFVQIQRDNPLDVMHLGKKVSLKIYDRQEICAGQSRYQIVEQPKFAPKGIYPSRRGDIMLLINGMPVFHIELKRTGTPISQATNQIKKYMHEGVFTGIFSLVQIFVAMTPEETKYFANPGSDKFFNEKFFFNWADFNNEKINDYREIARTLLHIPTAHQMIGFYTVADNGDGVLKVMRSYQYYAANGIADKVSKTHFEAKNNYGGYIWHTTGSGKTMTSFKSACLIAESRDADKVVFLMDRIELGTQSLGEYRAFADSYTEVQDTEDTIVLLNKLKSNAPQDTLIVTSIQKMSNLREDSAYNQDDIDQINHKRIVFIIDECHRSTFGDMLVNIKKTFDRAIFFGFTGTPIIIPKASNGLTQADVFGNEIHRYSIADGIRDGNVLGFDRIKVCTFKDTELREQVALLQSGAKDIVDAYSNPDKKVIYDYFMDTLKVKMVGYIAEDGKYIKGIEDYVPSSQYRTKEHHEAVIKDILDGFITLSKNKKYHAILATSSINEAIDYYYALRKNNLGLKVTAVFETNYDSNDEGVISRTDAAIDIIEDYNKMFETTFNLSSYKKFKTDIQRRLAHKKPYLTIGNEPEKQLDIVIVVDQMLTGYDSKWVNTLYLDKMYRDTSIQNIIQAFSRTNRLCDVDKPHGIIKYYRYPHTMETNINDAFEKYSGNKPYGIFVDKLYKNLKKMNQAFEVIKNIFESAGIPNFEKLPEDIDEVKEFVNEFNSFNKYLEPAKLQGFEWDTLVYLLKDEKGNELNYEVLCDKDTYDILMLRYNEVPRITVPGFDKPPFDIDSYLTETSVQIDYDWINSRFRKYMKAIESGDEIDKAKEELSRTFAKLSKEDQKYANIFLNDLASGNVIFDSRKSLIDYIQEYKNNAKNDQIHRFASAIGVDEIMLRNMMELGLNANTINDFGRFDKLKGTVNKTKAKEYFDNRDGQNYSSFKITSMVDSILRDFILKNGFDV